LQCGGESATSRPGLTTETSIEQIRVSQKGILTDSQYKQRPARRLKITGMNSQTIRFRYRVMRAILNESLPVRSVELSMFRLSLQAIGERFDFFQVGNGGGRSQVFHLERPGSYSPT